MKKLLIVLLTCATTSIHAQTTEEVKLYIESLVYGNQPSSYSYDIAFGEGFDDTLLEK